MNFVSVIAIVGILTSLPVHWFDFEKFYAEVKRTAKQKSIIVIVGYGRFASTKELDHMIDDFYDNLIGSYWDSERKYIDEKYQTIPFPFEEIKAPIFKTTYEWTFEQLVEYLETWSAVEHYTRQHGQSPVNLVCQKLRDYWGTVEKRNIQFQLLLRVGKIHN